MLFKLRIARAPVYAMLALFVYSGLLSQAARADIIATETLLAEANTAQVRQQLNQALEREDVLRQLQAHGVSAEAAAERVAAMTDREAQQLAAHFDELPAGGDVTLLLVVIILILLLR